MGKSLEKLNIVQISPVALPIRKDMKYGGTERVILYLDKEFYTKGHNSLVLGTGDSDIYGKLVPTVPRSYWEVSKNGIEKRKINTLDEVNNKHYEKSIDFILSEKIDVIHDQTCGCLFNSEAYKKMKEDIKVPILSTLHGILSNKNIDGYYHVQKLKNEGKKIFFNAISNSQKREFESAGIEIHSVVYHGIPTDKFSFEPEKSDYLLSLGRIAPEKGQHIAIEVAKRAGMRLIIAGEVHSVNENYWKELIEPHIDGEQIQFVGPKNDEEKIPLYQKAKAFLMPIQWPEPFGLVMIEAMSCGTPVVAFSRGSVPEVVKDGVTGRVIEETGSKEKDLEMMVEAVKDIDSINPSDCRKHVEEKFSIEKEAEQYLELYKKLID